MSLQVCIAGGLLLFWGTRRNFLGGYYLHMSQFNFASSHYLVYPTPSIREHMHLWETIY